MADATDPVLYPDGLCAKCSPSDPDHYVGPRGFCTSCGHFYDDHGMRILDVTVSCKVHTPINASCPHSGSLVD